MNEAYVKWHTVSQKTAAFGTNNDMNDAMPTIVYALFISNARPRNSLDV